MVGPVERFLAEPQRDPNSGRSCAEKFSKAKRRPGVGFKGPLQSLDLAGSGRVLGLQVQFSVNKFGALG